MVHLKPIFSLCFHQKEFSFQVTQQNCANVRVVILYFFNARHGSFCFFQYVSSLTLKIIAERKKNLHNGRDGIFVARKIRMVIAGGKKLKPQKFQMKTPKKKNSNNYSIAYKNPLFKHCYMAHKINSYTL